MSLDFIKKFIIEGKKLKLEHLDLPYKKDDLEPSVSKETIDYHYGTLYKAYVDRYNKGEGDPNFNEAGAFLHNILFGQYQKPKTDNKPDNEILELILKEHITFNDFKNKFEEVAMGIQGSGWVYLARNGEIKTIKNHQIKSDIVLLIDWWEHAWALDYQHDKKRYLTNQWKIINWDIINARLAIIG